MARDASPGEKAKPEMRVSNSDAQARAMYQSDKGLALSYHGQISTDAAHALIARSGGDAVGQRQRTFTCQLLIVCLGEYW